MTDHERLEVRSRAEWRAWLEAHHEQSESIWLVRYRKHHPDHLSWEELVQEALCFGWIDSTANKVDADRTMIRVSPRRPGSPWSGINKRHVAKLRRAGLMHPAGEARIAAAKQDGSWSLLDDAEALIEPDELRAALDATPAAGEAWAAFAPSSKKAILAWIALAKRPATRQKRIREIVRLATLGLRVNHPEAKGR